MTGSTDGHSSSGLKCRAAIVGLGRIASLLEDDSRREKPCTHAGAIAANPGCVLAGGSDTSEERRSLFEKRWHVPVYEDAEEMIRALSPGILVIATHPDSHYHYCRLAAASRIPVVICEKPLADTLSSARKVAALCSKGLSGFRPVIITNHERRYSLDYIKAKEILSGGKLGAILSVRAALYIGSGKTEKPARLLDLLWHDGTHLVDAIMFLTGLSLKHKKRLGAKLSSVTGTAWLEGELKKGVGDGGAGQSSSVIIPYSPLPVLIEVGAGCDHLVFEIEFSCSKGRLRIGNGVFEVWESVESPYAEKFRSLKQTTGTFSGPTGYFANMLADAVNCYRSIESGAGGRRPASSAADGLAVIEYLSSVKRWR